MGQGDLIQIIYHSYSASIEAFVRANVKTGTTLLTDGPRNGRPTDLWLRDDPTRRWRDRDSNPPSPEPYRRHAGWRRFVPVTTILISRPLHFEQTSRSRQSRTETARPES
jgi:hypothetical protein